MNKKHFYTAVILLSFLAAGIQPALATTHVIGPDHDPPLIPEEIGEWNEGTRTFTLAGNTPHGDDIQIIDPNLTLDGNEFSLTGPSSSGAGVDINGKHGITVKNLTITGFSIGINISGTNPGPENISTNTVENNTIYGCTTAGIRLYLANDTILRKNNISNNTNSTNTSWGILIETSGNSNLLQLGNTLTDNTLTGNNGGIWLKSSTYNTLELNTVTDHSFAGIYLSVQSENNTLADNDSSNNGYGILIRESNENTITGNTTNGNTDTGIWLDSSGSTALNGNMLTFNAASNNQYGIKLTNSNFNTLTNNTVSGNTLYGIWLDPSNNNQINNNNFITTTTQAYVADDSIDNNFDGNYWSDWEGSGAYIIFSAPSQIEIKDISPFAEPDGWLLPDTTPPEITCPGDTTIQAMAPDGVPIDDERIQTFLNSASATDNVDPPEDVIITNDAPAIFPPGDTIVTFTATDKSENSSTCQSTVTVAEAAEGHLRIIPKIINREGRLEKILAVIRFPEGTTKEDIDIGQPLILYPGDSPNAIEAINQRIVTWYRCGVLRVSVFARFSKDEVTAGVPENGPAELMVIGRFESGQYFYGFDNVWICSWNW